MPKNLSKGSGAGLRFALREYGRSGFTVIEIILVIVILGVASTIALPPMGRMRVTATLHNAREMVTSTIASGRATAIRYGRPSVVRFDSDNDLIWIEVDTTVAGDNSARDTLGLVDLATSFGVDMKANRNAYCFNSRGIGTTSAVCPEWGIAVKLSLGGKADSVAVNEVGRIFTTVD